MADKKSPGELSPEHEALHREDPKAGQLRVSDAAWGPVSGKAER